MHSSKGVKFARVSNFTKFSYRIRGEKRKCSALSLIDTQTRYTRDTRHTHTYIPYSDRLCPLHGLWAAAGWVDVYLVGLCCVPSALEAQRSQTHIRCDRKWGKCDIFVCYVYGLIFFFVVLPIFEMEIYNGVHSLGYKSLLGAELSACYMHTRAFWDTGVDMCHRRLLPNEIRFKGEAATKGEWAVRRVV